MKRYFFLFFLFVFGLMVRAQERDWSVEAYYPVSIGESFGSSNEGLLGLGVKYRFAEWGKARVGVALDGVWFATTFINDSDPIQEEKYRDFFLQPRLFAELPLTSSEKLWLTGNLGWSFNRSTRDPAFFDTNGRVQGKDLNNGPSLGLGLRYDFAPRWFLGADTQWIFLSGDSPSRTVGLGKIGVGFRF
ncbi:outer membrane protein [Robiginitalea sediminis]|uniref:outer membrane protein n=1 Tax=Robiginitalea sediminis TaxID=1982593 RepID=UPI000B4B41BB|nr:outer membrane beta-barrel protein [Robiginitalea sediminis]